MFPYINLFGRIIGSYSIMAIIGGLVAGFWACKTAKKKGLDDNNVIRILLFGALGVVIGGNILFHMTNPNSFVLLIKTIRAGNFEEIIQVIQIFFSGSVFFGGLIGGVIAGLLTIRILKLDMIVYTDLLTPAIPLFHMFGRIGCFLGGCCYGIESSYGLIYHQSLVESANFVRRFPVQLLEAGFNALLFLGLAYLLRQHLLKGRLFLLYLILYSVIRFMLEFLRGDSERGFIGLLSTSQFISIFLLVLSTVLWFYLFLKSRTIIME